MIPLRADSARAAGSMMGKNTMERLDVEGLHTARRQRSAREAFTAAVTVAGVCMGIAFVVLSLEALTLEGFMFAGVLRILSFVFGVSAVVASVCFAYIKR